MWCCAHCQAVVAFLVSATEKSFTFKGTEKDMTHIEDRVKALCNPHLTCSHTLTEDPTVAKKRGSKAKIIVTKGPALVLNKAHSLSSLFQKYNDAFKANVTLIDSMVAAISGRAPAAIVSSSASSTGGAGPVPADMAESKSASASIGHKRRREGSEGDVDEKS